MILGPFEINITDRVFTGMRSATRLVVFERRHTLPPERAVQPEGCGPEQQLKEQKGGPGRGKARVDLNNVPLVHSRCQPPPVTPFEYKRTLSPGESIAVLLACLLPPCIRKCSSQSVGLTPIILALATGGQTCGPLQVSKVNSERSALPGSCALHCWPSRS